MASITLPDDKHGFPRVYPVYDGAVLYREGWYALTRAHLSLKTFHHKFEINTKTLVALELTASGSPHRLSPFPSHHRLQIP